MPNSWETSTIRVSFFVDGFNLYHSVRETGDNHLKWLDLVSLCRAILGKIRGGHVYHEEKGTDVWLAATLIESVLSRRCDAAVIVSGDTDFAPAAEVARQRVPVWFAPPPRRAPNPTRRRHHNELRRAATGILAFKSRDYAAHQLPDRIVDPDGNVVARRPKEYARPSGP